MKRFFFDLVGATSCSYDYQGRLFYDVERAFEMAEAMALDLGCSETEDWRGFEVHVRDAAGANLFSIPVGDQAAAA